MTRFSTAMALWMMLTPLPIALSQEPTPAAPPAPPVVTPVPPAAPVAPPPAPDARTNAPTPVPVPPPAPASVPGMELLKANYANELRKEAELIRQQVEALRMLEKSRAERADYSGAARAKSASDALLAQHSWLTKPSANPAYVLDALNGVVAGGAASRDKDKGELVFSKAGGAVKWELPMRPGTYEVKIRYKAPSGYENRWGGALEFREDSGLAAAAPLKVRIAPAVEYNETVIPTQMNVMGTVTLGGSRATLVLRSTYLDGNSVGVAKVLGIDLTPVSSTPASAAASESTELLDLRQKHLKIQREKLQPTHQAWLNFLKEISAATEANPDPEIFAEKNRVTKLVGSAADPATPSILTTSGKARTIKLNPLDGLSVTSAGSLRTANSGTHLESITTGSRISFRITPEKVPAGSYRVVISTKMGPEMGGTYHLKVNDKTVSGEMTHNQYGSRAHQWEPKGMLKFPGAPCYLEFHVDSTLRDKGSLCDLYGVELIPVDSP